MFGSQRPILRALLYSTDFIVFKSSMYYTSYWAEAWHGPCNFRWEILNLSPYLYDSIQSYRTRSKLVLTDSYERNIADTDSMYVKIICLLTSSVFYKVIFYKVMFFTPLNLNLNLNLGLKSAPATAGFSFCRLSTTSILGNPRVIETRRVHKKCFLYLSSLDQISDAILYLYS